MAKDGGTRNTELNERFMKKVCLGFCGPDRAPRAAIISSGRVSIAACTFRRLGGKRPVRCRSHFCPYFRIQGLHGGANHAVARPR
jgi:hypothetical protein